MVAASTGRPRARGLALVVAGTHDRAVPRHHYDTLLGGIPGASGRLVDRADHTLAWTHTRELADLMRAW